MKFVRAFVLLAAVATAAGLTPFSAAPVAAQSAPHDTTPPRLLRGEIDGATMTLTFSEAMDPGATGGRFLMGIQTSQTQSPGCYATGEVAVDGATVTVGMGKYCPPARAGLTARNYLIYFRRADGGDGSFRDLAGNLLAADGDAGVGLYVKVDLANVTVGSAWVTGVAVVSSPGEGDTYALGETVRVAVTFSEAVTVTGTPRLKLDLGAGAGRWADYADGSGTKTLEFAWTVAQADASSAGVAVLADTLALNGGAIRGVASSKDAALSHAGLAPDASHKVDGVPDTTPPRLSATAVAGTKLTLSFDEAIDGAAPPASGAFTVKRTPPGSSEQSVRLSGTPAIEGARVTLTLAEAVRGTDTDVKVSYRKSGSGAGNRLRDAAGNEVAAFSDEPVANVDADTTPPELLRGKIDGGTITLYFSEPLDPDSVGGNFGVQVQYRSHSVRRFFATGDVGISGSTVTVGLGQGDPPDTISKSRPIAGSTNNTASYYTPLDPAATVLRDLAGNPVSTPKAVPDGRRRTLFVPLDNVTGVAPRVTGVAVSSDAGADRTYALNETIEVTVTFSELVDVTGTPRVKIDLSSGAGDEKWADYEEGSSTKTLEFAWTVAQGDASSAGVAVLANTLELNGGAIRSVASSKDAALSYDGLDHDPKHRVDAKPPTSSTASVDGATLKLSFDEALGAAAMLSNGAFTVKKTPQGSSEQTVSLSGSPVIDGATVTLTLTSPMRETDTGVKVSYTRPTSGTDNRLRDEAGNEVVSFSDQTVTNWSGSPRLSVANVNGTTLTLAFDEALGAAAMLSNGAFTVKKTPQGGNEQEVSLSGSPVIDGATVTLTLANAVLGTDTDVTVSYTRPTSGTDNRLVNEAGNEVVSFSNEPVENVTDNTPPGLSAVTLDGLSLTLTFDEPLGAAPMLSNGAFTVKKTPQGGGEQEVSLSGSPAISGATVTLTLASAVLETDMDLKVSYRRSGLDAGSRLRDASGNEVAGFDDEPVVNIAGDTTPPMLERGEIDGGTMTLTFSEALDPDSVGGQFRVSVNIWTVGETTTWREFIATGDMRISGGNEVTVGLGEGNPPAKAGQAACVHYLRPKDPAAGSLRDLAGNPVSHKEAMCLNNITAGPPSAKRGEVSSDAGGDGTYGLNEKIQISLTFNEAVTVTGSPRVKIDLSSKAGDEKWAVYEEGGGTATLKFAYTVAPSDDSREGIAVLRNTLELNGGTIRSAVSSESAALAHGGVSTFSDHRVDTASPVLFKANVDGATLTLIFDEALGAAVSLANGAFAVKKTPQGGGEQNVSLSGSPAIDGATVTLTLANAVLGTDTDVKVSYTRPTTGTGNRLGDEAGNEVESFTEQPVTKGTLDATPPRLERGEIDGGTATAYFSEPLDPDSMGGYFRVNVERSVKSWVSFRATGKVTISGNKVMVGLGERTARAQPGLRADLLYWRPADPAAKALRDLAGNPVWTPDNANGGRETRTIRLDNLTGLAPGVTGVAVSSDAGADRTYALNETIEVTVTFSEVVDVTGTSRVKIDLSSGAGDEQWADYEEGSGTKTLEFAWTVAQGDVSSAGVAVLANTLELNGGTIRSAAESEDAKLEHAGLAHDPKHKVEATAPTLSTATVDGTALTLTFNEPLSAAASLANGAFTVKKTPPGGNEQNVSPSGSPAIAGATVTLTLANAVLETDTGVKVSYARPTSGTDNRLRDEAGNEVVSFSDQAVTNGSRPPRVERAQIDGLSLTLTFDEVFGAAASLVNGAFTVKKTPQGGSEQTVSLSGSPAIAGATVTLTLANAVLETDTGVKVSYARPTSGTDNRLRDEAGNEVASFTDQAVGPDETAPTLLRGEIDGGTVTLWFSEPLDPDSVGGKFRVLVQTAGRSWYSFAATGDVTIIGNRMTVGVGDGNLRAKAGFLGTHDFSYTPPTDGTTGLRDLAGNSVGEIRGFDVDNVTGPPNVTGVAVSSAAGADRTYALDETIRVTLTFSEAVNVTGTPRLKIDFSSGAGDEKWADYEEGSGTETLKFAWTVAQGDASSAGVAVLANTLELNGGAIRSVAKSKEAALSHAGLAHDPNHRVDTPPAVTGVTVSSEAGGDATYGLGETIRVTVAFSAAVTVTGSPVLSIDMDPAAWGEKQAAYESGSGTAALVFAHTVVEPNLSTQGIAVLENSLALNGGTIESATTAGESATLAHAGLAHDPAHMVDWQASPDGSPSVTGVAVTSDAGEDATYGFGETIRVTVAFSAAVTVTGSPVLSVDMDPADWGRKQAAYESGGGTAALVFAHKVVEPNLSTRGIAVLADTLALNGGSIRSAATGADAALGHAGLAHAASHKVDWRLTTDSGPPHDTTPPRLLRGEIDGATMTLTFSEALDPDATGGRFLMGIQTSQTQSPGCYATGEVAVDGATVTVGMGKYCPPARAGLTARNYLIYFRRADGSDGSFRDLAGNLLAADGDAGVGLYVKVDLANVTVGSARVTGVAVVSDAGADQTYGAGEEIEVVVTFDVPVDVTGTPRLKIDMDPAEWGEKWAAYERGSGTASLTFVHTVAEPNLSKQGIAVLANTLELNGGTIRADGAAADIAHAGLAHDANHKVDWQRAAEREPLTARFVDVPATHGGVDSAFSFGLEFSEALERKLSSARLRTEALRATNATVTRTKRVVKGDNRRWTVTVRPESGEEVTVSLPATADCAAAGALCTADGRGLSNAVTATVSPPAASVTGVAVVSTPGEGDTYALGETVRVAVTFSEAVTVTGTPRLKLDLGAGAGKWAEYDESSGTNTLEFAWTVAQGDASSVGVAVLTNTLELNGGGIRAAARDQAADLAHAGIAPDPSHKVDGAPDTTPPRLSATAVAGTKLTLSFDEAIDAAAPPASGAFTVKRTPPGGSERSVGLSGAPAIEGAQVTLTLAEAVRGADTDVKVSYRKSGSDTGNRLRDAAGNEVAAFSDEPVTNVDADTTPPELERGEIDGGTVTLYFSEPLDPDSVGGYFRVRVRTTHGFSEYTATGEVSINGRVVTVGLGGTPATAGLPRNYFWYVAPKGPNPVRLQDLAGNVVRTPARLNITSYWSTPRLELDNVTGAGPATVTGVAVSSHAGADRTYALDETIEVTLTFSEAVNVTGTPRVKIDLSSEAGDEKWADYEEGNGTKTLEFAYKVAQGDVSSAGVAVLANTLELNGGTIRSAAESEDAELAHAGLAHDPKHKVETTAPTPSTATVDGTVLTITFNEALGASGSLANGAFTVKKTPQGGNEQDVSLSGAPVIDGATVTLTLANAVLETDTAVKVSYARPTSGTGNRLRDEVGNEVVSFTDQTVTNGSRPPRVERAHVDGTTVKLTFDEPLGAAASLLNGAFTVKKTPQGSSEQEVSLSGSPVVDGATVTLTLANAVLETDTAVKLSYTSPTSGTGNRLQDEAGNEVTSFTDQPVTNGSRSPRLSVASVDGATLTLTFDEALGAATMLANGAFTVKKTPQGGSEQEVSLSGSPVIDGATVTLTLANAVLATDTAVKVSYTRPTSGTGNRLRDEAGNEVGSFTDQPVSDTTPPRLVRGEIDGGTVTVYFSEPLDPDSMGGYFRVGVELSVNSWVSFPATGKVVISGNKVTFGLGERTARAQPGLRADLLYWRPADPAAKALRDLAGNPVRTPDIANGGRQTRTISLDNLTGVVPAVTGIEVSSDAGADRTYVLDETVEVTLTFSEAVDVTGTPRVKIDLSSGAGDEQWADYEEGSGTKTLEFAWTVAQGDASSAGVAVLANTLELNGGTIRSAARSKDAKLAHAGLAHDPKHVVDTTPPALSTATVDDTALTLTFDETLGAAASLATSAFTLKKTPQGGNEQNVSLSGTPAIAGATVTLTLADAVRDTDTDVKVSYTRPTSGTGNRLRDAVGNEVTSFSNEPVENATADSTPPGLSAVTLDGLSLTLSFDEPLGTAASLLNGAFTVKKTPQGGGEQTVSLSGSPAIDGATVTLTLTNAVLGTDTDVKVSYTRPTSGTGNRLRDEAGNEVMSFTDQAVGSDETAPTLVRGEIDGGTVTLWFSEPLDPNSVGGSYRVTVQTAASGWHTFTATGDVAVIGNRMTVGVGDGNPRAKAGFLKAHDFSYEPPTDGTRGLRDLVGNVVKEFDCFLVDNVTGPPLVTGAAVSSDAGADRTYALGETIEVTLTFSDAVDVTGMPRVRIDFSTGAGDEQWADYEGGSGTKTLDFAYEVAEPNVSTQGIAVLANTLELNGGAIRSVARSKDAALSHAGLAHDPAHKVDWRLSPGGGSGPATVTGVTMSSDAGNDDTYGFGDTIRVTVTFSEAVTVTGSPVLSIDMDPAEWGEKRAAYESGSGAAALVFAHTVVEPNISTQGIAVLADSLTLNGGTIESASTAGENAALSHAGLGHDPAHKVDWQASPGESPSVAGVAVTSDAGDDATYGFGETIRVTVTFSEAVTVTGSPELSIDMDPAEWGEKRAAYESGSGTAALVFAHTVVEPNLSRQGIAVLADSLALNGGTIRSAASQADAVLGHSGLGHDAAHKVDWRPSISVADARANEGAGAHVAFEVSLSRAFTTAAHSVTVDYATADGTAVAGEDYTATSGTLTFAAGETTKTVDVAVLDDAVDEGEETFVLRLSNATGGRIGDGEATGTIANDDPLQKMWLSRFGRTVAGHVTEAVSDRLGAPLTGARVTVGGRSVDLAQTEEGAVLRQALTAVARALGASEQPASGDGTAMGVPGSPTRAGAPAREVSGRELLDGSAFHLAGEGDGGGPGLAAWGRMTFGGFDGEEGADAGRLSIEGEVTSGILGADVEWNSLLAGVAVSVIEGEGTYSEPGVDTGKIESRMTAVSPYARLKLSERISVWGLAGWGMGDMTIEQAANEQQVERVTRTDIGMRVGGLGGRGALLESDETGGVDLGLKADAFYVETKAEAISNEGGTTAVASRVRLALEGSGSWETGSGVLTPGVEFGVRHDGGDAETGTGVEIGGSVRYTDPAAGLSVEARVRTLLAHEDTEYREWGASGAVRLAPGDRGRGVSFSLAPTYGTASSGVERLWSARDARGLTPGDGGFEPERRLEGELGYGLALFGDRFTGTPNLGFGVTDGSRDYRIGWRLTSAVSGAAGFEVSLDATRRETVGDSGPVSEAEHGVMLRGAIRW